MPDSAVPGVGARRSVSFWATVAGLSTVVAGVAIGAGIGRHDTALELAGAVVFSIVSVVTANAVQAVAGRPRAAGVFVASVIVMAAAAALAVGATTVDPGRDEGLLYTPTGGRISVYFHATAGGPELTGPRDPAPMQSGQGYAFRCSVAVDGPAGSTLWLRSSTGDRWVPATAIRTASGRVPTSYPAC